MTKGGIYIYVPHNIRKFYEDLGWEYSGFDDGYTARYKWSGKGKPILPDAPEVREQALREFDEIWPEGGR